MILKKLRPSDTIDVDGVKFAIRWSEVRAGTSFFIPCVETSKVTRQINAYFRYEGWKLKYQARSENGYFGVRIWRIM